MCREYPSNDARTAPGGITTLPCTLHACFVLPLLLLFLLAAACQNPDPVEAERSRTLTDDERYIVELFMKINEIEENLQDNPAEREEKYERLREAFDEERVRRILLELKQDPERWLTVYNRINELLMRREKPGTI
jgi:hypothetical protein